MLSSAAAGSACSPSRSATASSSPGVDTLVESVEGVPCGESHDAQVYAAFDLTSGTFPGQTAVDDQGSRYDRWQAAVGTVYEQDTVLDFSYFTPSGRAGTPATTRPSA